jgi:hypothetical protein
MKHCFGAVDGWYQSPQVVAQALSFFLLYGVQVLVRSRVPQEAEAFLRDALWL